MTIISDYSIFIDKVHLVLQQHKINFNPEHVQLSARSVSQAIDGDWVPSLIEYHALLKSLLKDVLTDNHHFLDKPYIKSHKLGANEALSIAIVNRQSEEWYGSDSAVSSFDFLIENSRSLFSNAKRFLDVGGHQLIWSIYYSKRMPSAEVVSYEPSPLNCLIGLFNCLINSVISQVDVIPFAVISSLDKNYESNMLVDFMNVPLKFDKLTALDNLNFDFVKIDIEGYEYFLLDDPVFINVMRTAKISHLELHLGHLTSRISKNDWIHKLRSKDISGHELYSESDMYDFLNSADPNGYFAFLVNVSK